MKNIFRKSANTWIGHALVAVFGSVAIAVPAHVWLGIHVVFGYTAGAVFWMMFYGWRESGDELRHKVRLKDWRKPSKVDGVTPRTDKAGDLLGPATWLVACLVWLVTLLVMPL